MRILKVLFIFTVFLKEIPINPLWFYKFIKSNINRFMERFHYGESDSETIFVTSEKDLHLFLLKVDQKSLRQASLL